LGRSRRKRRHVPFQPTSGQNRLPRAISEKGRRTHTYEVGDIAYWSPGPDVAIYYRHDGQDIPDPGVIVIGKIESGVEALSVQGSARVMVERIK